MANEEKKEELRMEAQGAWGTAALFLISMAVCGSGYPVVAYIVAAVAVVCALVGAIFCAGAYESKLYTLSALIHTLISSGVVFVAGVFCTNVVVNQQKLDTMVNFGTDGFVGVFRKFLMALHSWTTTGLEAFVQNAAEGADVSVVRASLVCIAAAYLFYAFFSMMSIICMMCMIKRKWLALIARVFKKAVVEKPTPSDQFGWTPFYPLLTAITMFLSLFAYVLGAWYFGIGFAVIAVIAILLGWSQVSSALSDGRIFLATTVSTMLTFVGLLWASSCFLGVVFFNMPKEPLDFGIYDCMGSVTQAVHCVSLVFKGGLDTYLTETLNSSLSINSVYACLLVYFGILFTSFYFLMKCLAALGRLVKGLFRWLASDSIAVHQQPKASKNEPQAAKAEKVAAKTPKTARTETAKTVETAKAETASNDLAESTDERPGILSLLKASKIKKSLFPTKQERVIDNLIELIELNRLRTTVKYFQVDGAIIGNGSQDFTKDYKTYSLNINGEAAQLVDIPGIEGKEEYFKDIISRALGKAHLVCYVARESKGLEESTLAKVNDYLRKNVTEVIGIHNIPLQPQKEYEGDNYVKDITEKVSKAAKNNVNIEEKLRCVVKNDLYKNTFGVAVLPGLCALAMNRGVTTFENPMLHQDNEAVCDSLMTLRRQQSSFLSRATEMELLQVSRLADLRNYIIHNCESAPSRIKKAALVRLKSTLESEYIATIRNQKNVIDNFRSQVNQRASSYISNLEQAAYRIKRNLPSAAQNAVFDFYRIDVLEGIIYPHIERNKKIVDDELEYTMNNHKSDLQVRFQNRVSKAMEEAINDFSARVQSYTDEYVRGMKLDIGNLSMELPSISVDSFNMGTLGNVAFTIGGYVMSGIAIGTAFPVIGNIVGGIVGAVVGVLVSIFSFFESDASKIRKCKKKAADAVEDSARDAWYEMSGKINSHAESLASCLDANIADAKYQIESAIKSYELVQSLEKKMLLITEEIQKNINQIKVA